MKVWGMSEDDLQFCAHHVGVRLYNVRQDGRALRFQLKLDTGSHRERRNSGWLYQRTSASYFNRGRKVAAVCWHGHRDFMRAVFAHNPEARIKTAIANYVGVQGFNETYPATAYLNIGSQFDPVQMHQACNCHGGDWLVDTSVSPGMTQYQMKQGDIGACPFVIFDPSHYRVDGSCKCNDPDEQDRMIREWDYTRADFEAVGR